jgi:hypothetical protein
VRHKFWTTGLRSCKVTISFYDCFVVAFAFTLVSLLPVCSKVRFSALSSGFKRFIRPRRCGRKNGEKSAIVRLGNRVFDDADCTQSSIDEDWLRREGIQAQHITLRTHVSAMRRAQVVGFG